MLAMAMVVSYQKSALKALRKIDRKTAGKLMDKIDAYAADPAGDHFWAKALSGDEGVRIRQGDYRAVCRIEGGEAAVLAVIRIGHRREVYR